MSQLTVIRIESPLNPQNHTRESMVFTPGQSITDLFPPLIGSNLPWAITRNGRVVDPEERAHVFPEDGDFITVSPVPLGGDDDGKSIIRIVAIIAVMYFSQGTMGWGEMMANSAYGAGLSGSTWASIFTVAGTMVVNAMLPPAKPGRAEKESPSYGIDGPKNTSAEGVVVPICYGQFRMGGNIIGNYVVNDGDTQILYMLVNAGEGPVASLTSPEINDQPIDNYEDWEVLSPPRLGTSDQPSVDWFASSVTPVNLGGVGEFTTAWKTFTVGTPGTDEFDRMRLDLVAPYGLCEVGSDSGKTFPRTVTVEIEYRLAGTSNPWVPLAFTNEIGPRVEEITYVDGFDPVAYVAGGGTIHRQGDEFYIELEEGIGEAAFTYRKTVGMAQMVPTAYGGGALDITGAKRNAYRRSLMTPKLDQGAYEIRYRRTTEPNMEMQSILDRLYLTEVNKIIDDPVSYRHTALFGLKVRLSEQLNGLPKLTYLNGGKIIKVWSPGTRTWKYEASSNPAWITWDILTNKRYGGGCAESRLDFHRWVEWAEHCYREGLEYHGVIDTQGNVWDAASEVARAGRGNLLQVGTRYSIVIERQDEPVQMFSVANMIADTFKESWSGMSDRANEIEVTFADKEDGYKSRTIRLYDASAILAGRPQRTAPVEIKGIVTAERAYREAQLMLNMNRWIQRSIEFGAVLDAIVCRPGDIINVQHDMPQWGYGGMLEAGSTTTLLKLDRPVEMVGGVNYKALIHQDSVLRLATTVKSVASDVIILNGYDGARNVRRIKIGSSDQEILSIVQSESDFGVVVPSTVGILAGAAVELWDTNVMATYNVVNPVAALDVQEVTALTLSTALPTAPAQFTKWLFGQENKITKPFRVTKISGTHEYRRDIQAIEYYPQIYEDEVTGPPPNYSDLDERLVDHVTIDGVTESGLLVGSVFQLNATVSYFSSQQTYSKADVYVSRSGGPFKLEGSGFDSVTIPVVKSEELVFRVVARDISGNSAGVRGAPTFPYTVSGKAIIPPDVTGLNYAIKPGQAVVYWDAVVSLFRIGTELRVGENWDLGEFLWSGSSTDYKHARPPNGTYKVWAKHISTTGDYSENAVSIDVLIDDSIDFSAGTGGTLKLTTDRFPFFSFLTGTTHVAQPPGDGLLTITANLVGLFGTASFTAEAFDSRVGGSSLGPVTLGGSGNVRTLSAEQFVAAGIDGAVRRVRITATLGTATDTIDVFRQDSTTTEPILYLSNPTHAVPTDESGEFGDYSGAQTDAVIYEGITDTTDDWVWSIAPDAGVSATINGGSGPISAPSSVQVAVSAMTVATGAVLVQADNGTETLTASFVVDKSQANGSGYQIVWSPRSEINLPVDSSGNVTSYADAWSEYRVIKGGQLDDTTNWTATVENINIASTRTGSRIDVTELFKLGEVLGLEHKSLTPQPSGWATPHQLIYGGGTWLMIGWGTTSKVRTSSDDGATWVERDTGLTPGFFSVGAYVGGAFLLFGGPTVYGTRVLRSADNGVTWTEQALPVAATVFRATRAGSDLIVSTSTLTSFRTSNGTSWVNYASAPNYGAEYATAGTKWAATDISGNLFTSSNSGASWTAVNAGQLAGNWSFYTYAVRAFRGLLIAFLYRTGGPTLDKVLVSEDGVSWSPYTLPSNYDAVTQTQVVSGVLYFISLGKLFWTTDGKRWEGGAAIPGITDIGSSSAYTYSVQVHDELGGSRIMSLNRTASTQVKINLAASSATEGAALLRLTKPGALPMSSILPVFKGTSTPDMYAFGAFPGYLELPATSDGVVTDWSQATIRLEALKNAVPDTANWTWTWTAPGMTPSSGTGSVVTFTAMTGDTAQLFVRASKPGHADLVPGGINIVKRKGTTSSGPVVGGAFHVVEVIHTYVALRFRGNGMVQVKRGSSGSWVDYVPWAGAIRPENNSKYLRVDASGHALDVGTTGVFLALTTDREFVLIDTSSGVHTTELVILIADDSAGTNSVVGFGSMRLIVP